MAEDWQVDNAGWMDAEARRALGGGRMSAPRPMSVLAAEAERAEREGRRKPSRFLTAREFMERERLAVPDREALARGAGGRCARDNGPCFDCYASAKARSKCNHKRHAQRPPDVAAP